MHLDQPIVALVGPPNAGKTTLYNWLTGLKYKVVNYPGSTVEFAIGSTAPRIEKPFIAIDTPGIHSLNPRGEDEEITRRVLISQHSVGAVSHVLLVIDGTQLERHLTLVTQLKEVHLPVILVLTMADLLERSGLKLDLKTLEAELGCPVVLFDGLLGKGLVEVATAVHSTPRSDKFTLLPEPWTPEKFDQEFARAKSLCERVLLQTKTSSKEEVYRLTRRIDRALLHPFWGPLSFVVIMGTLFASIFWLAAPLMDFVDGFFSGLAVGAHELLPASLVTDFLSEGLITGFGAVLVFVPQIFILFFGVGILESTGYLARAAALIDRPLSKLGMSGRSFVPILSGFACAVPAMMATRNLSSKRDRWITNFIIPLMTCSARLPVYGLLLAMLFVGSSAWLAGLAMAGLYGGALIIGAVAAGILNRFLKKDQSSVLMMELPLLRFPNFKHIFHQSLKRTISYVQRAGPVILVLSILIWVGSTFPRLPADAPLQVSQLEQSYLGQMGRWIDPLMEPMGADWRVGVGLISAFAAREVFVSTLAVIFAVQGGEENTESLMTTLSTATHANGSPLFTGPAILSLLVFFMIALQCMSTFAVAKKESGSWGFAVSQLVTLNIVAYFLAVAIYQVTSIFVL